MTELLVELFTEEIPARMQLYARNELPKWWQDALKQYGIEGQVEVITTPRRLTVAMPELKLIEIASEKRGPRVGADDKVVAAFAASCGVAVTELITETTPKGEFYFYRAQSGARDAAAEITNLIHHWLNSFTWPKSMRWEASGFRWVRPIRSIIALYEGKVLPVQAAGLKASNKTYGHRVLGSGKPVEINSISQYRQALEKENVVLDHSLRAKLITEQARALAEQHKLVWEEDQKLLTEVADLVEKPHCMVGKIDQDFMRLPAEILTTTMKHHQRYFALYNKSGELAPYFLFAASHAQAPDVIKAGNEKVLRARLSDALFYWDNDLAKTDSELHVAVAGITYHNELGSIADKTERIAEIASTIAGQVSVDAKKAAQAAKLCKLDLAMNTVREFPEMQGIAGSYWAKHHGYEQDVAAAIEAHYRPNGSEGALPEAELSAVLALADRLDHLVGFFAIGKAPTGSKDPFALRRAALGALRLLLSYRWSVQLNSLLELAAEQYKRQGKQISDKVIAEIVAFFNERARLWWRGVGYRHDLVDAVMKAAYDLPICRIEQRLEALAPWVDRSEIRPLLLAAKRAANILAETNIKAVEFAVVHTIKAKAFHPSEAKVCDELEKLYPQWEALVESADVQKLIEASSPLVAAIDQMFLEVKINDDDPKIREQRLTLLGAIKSLFDKWIHVSELEGA